MPGERQVAVTREGAVGALKLLMIVLAAVTLWESGSAINREFHARGLLTAPPFLRGASTLLVGTETTAPFQERVQAWWRASHRLIALFAIMAAAILLTARYLMLGRVLDFLYLESAVSDRRIYSGFVANIFLVLTHAGIIYGIVFLGREGHAQLVPMLLLAFFGFNFLWSVGVYLSARQVERRALRGMRFLALTAAAALVVLFALTWGAEAAAAEDAALRGSRLTVLGAGIAILACAADAIVQGLAYRARRPSPLPSTR